MVSNHSSRQKGLTTVVKSAEILAAVLDRIADDSPQQALLDSDEVSAWPSWILPVLVAAGLFQETSRPTEVFCDGCHWACLKPVVVRILPSGLTRAFVSCDEEPGLGRIEVAPEQLKRYIATVDLAARFVGRSLGLKSPARSGLGASVIVGHVKGRNGHRVVSVEVQQGQLLLNAGGHCVALSDLVHWDRRALTVDHQAIRRLINRKATRSSPECPFPSKQHRRKNAKRDQQIRREAGRLKRQKTWTMTRISEHISRMELADGISAARVRRILYEQNS
jgi:hypothetical protein